jgi:pilus assembly protein CpaB
MGRIKGLVLVVLALGLAGATAYTIRSWLEAQRQHFARQVQPRERAPEREPARTANVLVAVADLSPGQFIRPESLRWQAWPEGTMPPSYVVEGRRALQDFVGAVVRHPLAAGEPVTEGKVVTPGNSGFLAAVLSPGFRAASIAVNITSGISGFIFPGDRVDVILTHDLPGEGAGNTAGPTRRASVTILTDLRVLAIDQRVDQRATEPAVARTTTLEVTPRQGEMLAVAAETGRLTLSLRSLAREDQNDSLPPAPGAPAQSIVAPAAEGTVPAPTGMRRAQGQVPSDQAAPDTAEAPAQSYTLDSDTTHLLPPWSQGRPQITVFRGQRTEQVNIGSSSTPIRGGPQ